MPKARSMRALREQLASWDSRKLDRLKDIPEFAELYYAINPSAARAYQISSVTANQIQDVLGVNIRSLLPGADEEGVNWILPIDTSETPSEFFNEHMQRLRSCFDKLSEPLTRSYLDAYLLEILYNLPQTSTQKLKFFGEVSFSYTSDTDKTLNGFGEWIWAYGEEGRDTIENISLIGEAKNSENGIDNPQYVAQILAYMLAVHKLRKKAGKTSAAVYGFLSNLRRWQFFHVDHDGQLRKSKEFNSSTDHPEVLAALRYIFRAAQLNTPTTTPAQSDFPHHDLPLHPFLKRPSLGDNTGKDENEYALLEEVVDDVIDMEENTIQI